MNKFLISEVELAVTDDWVDPDLAAGASLLRKRVECEATQFFKSVGSRLYQNDLAIIFLQVVKQAVGVADRSFAYLSFILVPNYFARRQILTGPTCFVRVSVQVIVDKNDSAMVVLHVDLKPLFARVVFLVQLNCLGTNFVSAGDENSSVFKDGSWNDGRSAFPW